LRKQIAGEYATEATQRDRDPHWAMWLALAILGGAFALAWYSTRAKEEQTKIRVAELEASGRPIQGFWKELLQPSKASAKAALEEFTARLEATAKDMTDAVKRAQTAVESIDKSAATNAEQLRALQKELETLKQRVDKIAPP
jgi:flagellin-like hook-associated protein FlgL